MWQTGAVTASATCVADCCSNNQCNKCGRQVQLQSDHDHSKYFSAKSMLQTIQIKNTFEH